MNSGMHGVRTVRHGLAMLCLLVASLHGAAAPPVAVEMIVGGLSAPVEIVDAGDSTGRLFIVEQSGRIRIVRNGVLLPTPFLDIRSQVVSGGERGLLGLAFPPHYKTTGRFFVNYTRAGDGATVIASYQTTFDPDLADPASRVEVLVVAQPFEEHNGGALRFGPDGYLYIGMGDGGSGNDPDNRAQNTHDLLGKLLRIDVANAVPYAVPPDNPFFSGGGRQEIWATGLRNPWRFSFDRLTGDLYIGDVGQAAQEEIDFVPYGLGAGSNFGWRVMEGARCTGLAGGAPCESPALTLPILTYGHDQGCAVTGGVVYRGARVPVLYGRYLYGDFCSGRIFAAHRDADGRWRTETLLETTHQIGTFGEDADGEVYWSDLRTGTIHRMAAAVAAPVAIEYYNATLQHYFMTAEPAEAAALDDGALNGAWTRTGYAFPVATPGAAGAIDVCRFFGTPGVGPNSHFYTGFANECASLRANALWTFEGVAFRAALPTAGVCAPALTPVYRLYNDPATLAAVNHRYTTDGSLVAAMRLAGWIIEGVAFCVP
jgi:glucose/arabinose dehydrogenase